MELKIMSDELFQKQRYTYVVLYIGQNSDDIIIKNLISKYNWSCIITTRTDAEFRNLIKGNDRENVFDRNAQQNNEQGKGSKLSSDLLNQRDLNILRLLGIDTGNDISASEIRKKVFFAGESLGQLAGMLSNGVNLVITGIDSEADKMLFENSLIYRLFDDSKSINSKAVSFWGMPKKETESDFFKSLRKECTAFGYKYEETSIADVIRFRLEEDETFEDEPLYVKGDEFFYSGEQMVTLSIEDRSKMGKIGSLLTEQLISKIKPVGEHQNQDWFYRFHEYSCEEPQWYGYSKNSQYHVKRSYEDTLVQLVRRRLGGREIEPASSASDQNSSHSNVIYSDIDNKYPCPIILSGNTCSSKTISLGALAFRIFNEKLNPVLYLSKSFNYGESIGDKEDLDNVLQHIGKIIPNERKILIIWDSSDYRSIVSNACNLAKFLYNRGRRFVLVCTAYSKIEPTNSPAVFYRLKDSNGSKTIFEKVSKEDATVTYSSNCYFVNAESSINQKEIQLFWNTTEKYSGLGTDKINKFKKELEKDDDNFIINYYYKVIFLLREKLENKLGKEELTVSEYIENERKLALGTNSDSPKSKSVMRLAMENALRKKGLDPDKFLSDNDEHDKKERKYDPEHFRSFNNCIALFSRFKLKTPRELALYFLGTDDHMVLEGVPWIVYNIDENSGKFYFSYRSSLEAEMHLRINSVTGKKQMNILLEIIDKYLCDYKENDYVDREYTQRVQDLIRFMGPNSNYIQFKSEQGYKEIFVELPELIDKLCDIVNEVECENDEDFVLLLVSIIREYYGNDKKEEDDIFHCMNELIYAYKLARDTIEMIKERIKTDVYLSEFDKNHLFKQYEALINEKILCRINIYKYNEIAKEESDYDNFVKDNIEFTSLRYSEIHKELAPIILRNPTNGYFYNTLFRTFETYTESGISKDEPEWFANFAEVSQIIDICQNYDYEITNRGKNGDDELSRHMTTIKSYLNDYPIDIDAAEKHMRNEKPRSEKEASFFKMFDDMLNSGKSAAITLICRKELNQFALSPTSYYIDDSIIANRKRVYDFMTRNDIFRCVSSDSYAMALLIRVAWQIYNKTVLTHRPECQITVLNNEQWADINRLCAQYVKCSSNSFQPLIILLYALSELQHADFSILSYQNAYEKLQMLDEEMFYQSQSRIWTPFIICNEDGTPKKYNGQIQSFKEKTRNGFMNVSDVPNKIGSVSGIRFNTSNLLRDDKIPNFENDRDFKTKVWFDLVLGIGYTSFSVYTEEGAEKKFRME